MCMSTAYEQRGDETILLCENVKNAMVSGDEITFVDILGSTVTVKGVIKKVDLIKNIMLVDAG